MRVLLLTLMIIYHSQSVSCKVFYLKSKIDNFASYLIEKIHNLKMKLKSFFFEPKTTEEEAPPSYTKYQSDTKMRDGYTDFIDAISADNFTGDPDFLSLRSEPTALMSTNQLARLHGMRVETHRIFTSDGYLLTMHRLLSSNGTATPKQTVILHHGLLGSSTDWILLGAEKSLPYILSDAGYDVWLLNARGNYYSRGHMSMNVDTKYYWKFTFQEMGEKDLPAVIDYIRGLKGSSDLIDYVGHSLGASALLVMLATNPVYNDYLRVGVLFAPLVFMSDCKGPLKFMTSFSMETQNPFLKMMGSREFLPSRQMPTWIATEYCKGSLMFCSNPYFFITGIPTMKFLDKKFLATLLYHVPAGTSSNTILHFAQLAKSGKFHKFNDESDEYDLSRVTLPIALFSSSDDMFVSVSDVLKLHFSIPNPIEHYVVRGQNISHGDFVWGENANKIIFNKVIEFLTFGLNWEPYKKNKEPYKKNKEPYKKNKIYSEELESHENQYLMLYPTR